MFKVGKCKCGKYATVSIETKIGETTVEYFCAEHYVEHEGEHCLENELEVIREWEDYDSMDPEIAKEIGKQFPVLADKYGKVLRKVVRARRMENSI